MAEKAKRTPKNVQGPFFVEADLCMACCLPEREAPELMAFDEDKGSCYFKRQPVNSEETKHALHAMAVSCCGAVQYDGDDPTLLKLLKDLDADGWRNWNLIDQTLKAGE